jgi:tetratricopeptide (TPR) repeat protein
VKVVLDPPTPAEQSLVWRVHDGYFRARGIRAWTAGEVPWYATSNLPTARAHAAFLLEVAPAEGPIAVLEVGSGLGQFAARFVSALRRHLGDRGRALLARLRYYLTDYSEKNLREAVQQPAVAAEVDAGVLVPLVLDVRAPAAATDLAGAPVPLPPLSLVLGNYVACVLPSTPLQWRGPGGWFVQWLSVAIEAPPEEADRPVAELREALLSDPTREDLVANELALDVTWARTPLREAVPDPVHRAALAALVAGRGDLTLSWPRGFLAFVEAAAPLLAPHGYVACNDYGTTDLRELAGLDDRRPQVYGNSLAHGVVFPALAAWAEAAGWGALHTTDPLESVHSAVLRPRAWSAGEREAFRAFDAADDGDEIVDASTVAKRFADAGQPERALRFFRRCLALEPDNVEHLHRAGRAAIDAGRYELAVELLEQGRALDPEVRWDFAFQLGRATCLLEDWDASRRWYELATTQEDHPVTWTNLGIVYEELGRVGDALRCYEAARRADPADDRSRQRIEALRDRFWAEQAAALRGAAGQGAGETVA